MTDVQESLFWVRYRPRADNQMVIFADDASPRWITQLAVLDNATAAVADKFGNIIILRLPPDVNDNVEEDPSGTRSLWDRNALGGASQKLEVRSRLSFVSANLTGFFFMVCILNSNLSLSFATVFALYSLPVHFS